MMATGRLCWTVTLSICLGGFPDFQNVELWVNCSVYQPKPFSVCLWETSTNILQGWCVTIRPGYWPVSWTPWWWKPTRGRWPSVAALQTVSCWGERTQSVGASQSCSRLWTTGQCDKNIQLWLPGRKQLINRRQFPQGSPILFFL